MLACSETAERIAPPRRRGKPPARGKSVSITAVSWTALDDLPTHEWVMHGKRLGVLGRGVGWWLGDWLRYGNARYGERYVPAARTTGYDVQTLMNMVYVASRFEPSRRREKLTWSHHAELAAQDQELQEYWLTRAEDDRLSVRCLREELRRERRAAIARGEADAMNHRHELVCPKCGSRFSR